MMTMMMKATTVFGPEEREKIEAAVGEVEKTTSAEIVCAVATESGRYDRAEAIIGLAVAVIALGLAHAVQGWFFAGQGEWTGALPLGWQAFAVVAGFIAGNVLASRVPGLRRLVVGEREMAAEVRQAAAHAFLLGSVANTSGGTGLLIYVTLFERRVWILADRTVREALGDAEIERLRDLAVDEIRRGDFVSAYIKVMNTAAPLLEKALPADRSLSVDELPNHVLTFHPRPGAGGSV